jgi:hypothetical protein
VNPLRYVLVIVTADGTVSAQGTATGRPFQSREAAEKVAARYPFDDGYQAEVCVLECAEEKS